MSLVTVRQGFSRGSVKISMGSSFMSLLALWQGFCTMNKQNKSFKIRLISFVALGNVRCDKVCADTGQHVLKFVRLKRSQL